MITIPASETVNSIISHVNTSNAFKSEPKIIIGVIGAGVFFIIRVPKILQNEILNLTKKTDIACESVKFIESLDDFDYQKSNREKFIDKIKAGNASRWAYTPRLVDIGCWDNYRKRDKRTRDKKFVEVRKKNRQRTIAKMKITGFPIFQSEKLGILDTITE